MLKKSYDHLYFDGILRDGDAYVEIGAYTGTFLERSGLVRSGCRYYLYEPSESACQVLREKFGQQVAVLPLAVSTMAGTTLYANGQTDQGNTVWNTKSGIPVYATGLRAVVAMAGFHVGFMAINAECSEYELLQNPAINNVDYISCEFHPGKSGINTVEFINQHLADQFKTIALTRMGEPYNLWFGMNKRLNEPEPIYTAP